MKPLVIDTECSRNAHVFNYFHKMYMLGLYNGTQKWIFPIEWVDGKPYGPAIDQAKQIIEEHDLLIAFNAKFDLQWLRRYGIKTQHKKIWCLQYAEFCISGQRWRMPNLDDSCARRGLPGKTNVIKTDYWDKGLEINAAPWEVAEDYNWHDLKAEYALFQAQAHQLETRPQLKRLIWHGSQDIQITAEMEWNGMKYDHELSVSKGTKLLGEVSTLKQELGSIVNVPQINWESPRHLSALLYGGAITYVEREPYTFTYKDPKRAPIEKLRKVEKTITLPRLVDPLRGSENDNGWSTEEGVLKRLKAGGMASDIITRLLRIRGLNKLVGTYYHGIPLLSTEMTWENGIVHGQLHHCVTQTGRLSSSNPNLQNVEYGVRECLVSRY